MRRRTGLLLASASGVLAALSFPTPGLWPLAFVAWAPLIVALDGARPRRGALVGFAGGLVFYLVALRWLLPLTVFGLGVLAAALAGYSALFGAAAALLLRAARRTRHPAARALLSAGVPAAWVALEWIRSWALTGFGWAAAGYALAPAPVMIQAAALGGVFSLSFAIVACNTALARAWPALRARTWRAAAAPLAAAAAAPALLAIYGAIALAGGTGASEWIRVAAIQADISPHDKWTDPGTRASMSRYVRLTTEAVEQHAPDLVVWPETAIPEPLADPSAAFTPASDLRRRVDHVWRVPLLWGTPERARDRRYWNSAVLYHPDGAPRAPYRKSRLVPFAEYSPLPSLLGFVPRVLSGPEIVHGDGGPPFEVAGARVGVMICFEDVFSDEAIDRAERANVLTVITNDAWFSRAGREQHLDIAVLRAVETRRAIARAANNGVTALIDPLGRVLARAPDGQAFAVDSIPIVSTTTPFAAAPDLVPLLLLALALGLSIAAVVRDRTGSPASPGDPV